MGKDLREEDDLKEDNVVTRASIKGDKITVVGETYLKVPKAKIYKLISHPKSTTIFKSFVVRQYKLLKNTFYVYK